MALLLLLSSLAIGQVTREARVSIAGEQLVVGAPATQDALAQLDCRTSQVQNTVRSCALKPAVATFARCLGRGLASARLNVHFQGDVVNMMVEFASAGDADGVIAQLTSLFGRPPTLSPWADDEHLYASHIWVDRHGEVELTKTIKGPDDGKVRLYVSSFAGRPIHPGDLPNKKP